MEPRTAILFRPIGPQELERIRASGGRAFPPRPHHQPVFSATREEGLARGVARDWSLRDAAVGYVVRFALDADFAARPACPAEDGEWCIAAEEVAALNRHLVGPIELVATYRPPSRALSR